MKLILFFSRELKFFFGVHSELIIYDQNTLPFFKKFLTKIHVQTFPSSKNFLVRCCPTGTILILSIRNSILSFPIDKISLVFGEKVEFFIVYNKRVYSDFIKVINILSMKENEEGVRVCPSVKGAIVFHDEMEEDEKEVVEMGVGMLTLHSPEEIIKEFM